MSPEIHQVLPKYLQIANYIRDQILRGELQPGDEVPSERQIVEDWGVSRPTATRALASLRAEGLVESRQGLGTYVRHQPRLNRRARDRYARARATGRAYTPGESSEITDVDIVPAPEEVAASLGIDEGEPVIKRRRVIRDQSGPVEVSTSWFDARIADAAPRLLERDRIRQGTLRYIEETIGRRGETARDTITARLATSDEARDLRLAPTPAPVLLVHHLTFDDDGEPIEFVEAVYPPDRWIFEDEYGISR